MAAPKQAAKQTATADTIIRDVKAKMFAPVYYLMGAETYYIDLIANAIVENALMPEECDFNLTVLYGPDTTAAQVVDVARRYPMMSDRQVVMVKEAQNLKHLEPLEAYLKQPQASTVLVLCHKNGTIDRRKKVAQMIEQKGVLFESKQLKDRDLIPFIEKYLTQRGATIDLKSQQIIADSIGADLNRLVGELDKLLIALSSDDKRVTPALVEKQIGVSKDFNVFELKDAIANRNVFKANQIIKYFNDNPKSVNFFYLVPFLFAYFQNLMIAYYCPQKNNPDALAAWLDLKFSWSTKEYLSGMRNYSGVKVMQIISKIREIDAKGKGLDNPSTSTGELLKELIFFIMH